ncbi:MAG: hypothetical protein HY815_10430 [Candidatus Riflebacteria bacterium]|nr:hypothetical protein [Candidatus Riflebacteria bacterium]
MDDFGPLKDLIRAFTQSSFTRFAISGDGVRIQLRQSQPAERRAATSAEPVKVHVESRSSKPRGGLDTGKAILSTRVGHFFPSRNQQGELALKEGDLIEQGQALGIVESMNLKYEIKADRSGLVDRYLIEDGEAVEFGQPLILLK